MDPLKSLHAASASLNQSNLKELEKAILEADNPALANRHRVYQIWEDGTQTSQKAGDLLWRRTLFTVNPALKGVNIPMPHKYSADLSYIYVTEDDAKHIRKLMSKLYLCSPDEDDIIHQVQRSAIDLICSNRDNICYKEHKTRHPIALYLCYINRDKNLEIEWETFAKEFLSEKKKLKDALILENGNTQLINKINTQLSILETTFPAEEENSSSRGWRVSELRTYDEMVVLTKAQKK